MTDFVEMPLLPQSDEAHGGRFVYQTATDLQAVFKAAAARVAGQANSRRSYAQKGSQDFKGFFATVFSANATAASGDAKNLASALQYVADAVPTMLTDAREEDQRRKANNAWVRHHNDRSGFEKMMDGITHSEEPRPNNGKPGKGPTFQEWTAPVKSRTAPAPGGGGGVVSAARPENLRAFAAGMNRLNDQLRNDISRLNRALDNFAKECTWVKVNAEGVVRAYHTYLSNNSMDAQWATTLAAAFEKAGGTGGLASLPDAALDAVLRAASIGRSRTMMAIDSPTVRGALPSTGYADDPVNAATGNFIEPECDLGFTGLAAGLSLTRTYNSVDTEGGLFGTGWSSVLDQGLSLDTESARWLTDDGRVIVFPRAGKGWGRAVGDNYWLAVERPGDGAGTAGLAGLADPPDDGEDVLVARDNAGSWWAFTLTGSWLGAGCGHGRTVSVARGEHGAPIRLAHGRGRHVDIAYRDGQVVSVVTDDGRRVDYGYEDGRLVEARTADGARRYVWDGSGRVAQVVSAAGVVEVDNTYNEQGQVTGQTSAFGRTSRYTYLPGGVTVVADEDGERPNTWIHDAHGRLVGAVDSYGYRQSMSWDEHGNPVMITERDGSTTVQMFDERGRLTRRVTPEGSDTSYAWDPQDRLTAVSTGEGAATTLSYDDPVGQDPSQITDPLGGLTRLTWRDGLLGRVVDPAGVSADLDYDDAGNLTAVRDADGHQTRFEWDEAGRLVLVVSPSGAETRYTWDDAGRPVARRDADGAVWRFEYDGTGRQTAVVDPMGARTVTEYASNGQVSRLIDPLGRVTEQEFDDLGNLAQIQLPDGARWLFGHDSLSRLRSLTDPDGGQWLREYDRVGAMTAVVDPSGVGTTASMDRSDGTTTLRDAFTSTQLRTDRFGRPVRVEHPDGSAELTSYDAAGNIVEMVDADGALTRIERDVAGRVSAIVSPRGAVTRFGYDRCGRPWRMTDPAGGVTELEYDSDQRVVSRRLPDGETEEFCYDPMGRLTEQRVPGSGVARWRYDLCGRMVWSRDPVYGTRRFSYNLAGELVETINGVGGRTRFDHDERGRLVRVVDPVGGETRYGYTDLDGVASVTDPLGRVTEAHYDAAGRLASLAAADGHITEWTFDRAGRLSSMAVDGQAMVAWRHDPAARTVSITDHTRPDGQPVSHQLVYDPAGRLVARTRRVRTGVAVGQSWAWDADGNRTSFTDSSGRTTAYEYDSAGRLVGVGAPALPEVVYSYDPAGRLDAARAGQVREAWARRDETAMRHTVTQGDRATSATVERDDEGRIVAITVDDATTWYSYDGAGQLIEAVTEAGGQKQVRGWRYDAAGRLAVETGPGGRVEYFYDPAGQLVRVSGPGGGCRYAYDGRGRRIRCETDDGVATDFTWSAAGGLAGISVYGPDRCTESHRLWVDVLGEVAEVDGVGLWWDTASGFPTLTGVGDASVANVPGGLTGVGAGWRAAGWRQGRANDPVDPWVQESRPWGVLPEGVGVTGSGSISIAGLEVLGARLYDPGTRGFLSPDPLGPVLGAGWSANPYAYAGNNPLGLLDPSGLRPTTDADLAAFDANSRTSFGGVGRWFKNNWQYVAAGAGIALGVGLACTGIGGPAGIALMAASGALISGGVTTVSQKAQTGTVDWKTVGFNALVGGVTGGATGGAALWGKGVMMSAKGVTAAKVARAVGVNAGVNGTVGAGSSAATYLIENGSHIGRGSEFAGALVGGTFSGVVGGLAGPAGGSIAQGLRRPTTGLLAKASTAGLSGLSAGGGSIVDNMVSGDAMDSRAVAGATVFGIASSPISDLIGNHSSSQHGVYTLKQVPEFSPHSVSGAVNLKHVNTLGLWGSAIVGAAVGGGAEAVKDLVDNVIG